MGLPCRFCGRLACRHITDHDDLGIEPVLPAEVEALLPPQLRRQPAEEQPLSEEESRLRSAMYRTNDPFALSRITTRLAQLQKERAT